MGKKRKELFCGDTTMHPGQVKKIRVFIPSGVLESLLRRLCRKGLVFWNERQDFSFLT